MDSAKLLDFLTSLPVSHAILPCAVCFATSCPANHAICSFIDSSGYASGPIRRCLFIDYIIMASYQYFTILWQAQEWLTSTSFIIHSPVTTLLLTKVTASTSL